MRMMRLTLITEGCCEMALLKRTLLLGLLVCLFGSESRAAEDKPIAIVHARLIDGMGGPPVENATVIVRGRMTVAQLFRNIPPDGC